MTEFQLRVLSGRYQGANHPLTGRCLSIGHEFWNDVVLREPGTRGLVAELAPAADAAAPATLTLLAGTMTLLGNPIATGSSVQLPAYMPVFCNDMAIAWGEADSRRWSEAEALAAAPDTAAAVGAAAGDNEVGVRWWDVPLRGAGRFARGSVTMGAVVAAGALAMVPTSFDALLQRADAVEDARSALRGAGFPKLAVREDPEGGVIVSGEIAGEQDRPAISYALAEAGVPATLAVRSGAERARAAVSAARVHGFVIAAAAQPGNILEIHHGPLDSAGRQRLADVLRRDVPGAGQLRFAADMAPPVPPLRQISDATKRVSSVVAGDPGYIVTVDGAHYFPGAVLPSGHRLVAIETASVVLEQGGKQSRLSF